MSIDYIQTLGEFDIVLQAEPVLVVEFVTTHCEGCMEIDSSISQLADEYENQAKFFKVDIDTNPEAAVRCSVQSTPTLVVMKQGEIVEQLEGTQEYTTYKSVLDEYANPA